MKLTTDLHVVSRCVWCVGLYMHFH